MCEYVEAPRTRRVLTHHSPSPPYLTRVLSPSLVSVRRDTPSVPDWPSFRSGPVRRCLMFGSTGGPVAVKGVPLRFGRTSLEGHHKERNPIKKKKNSKIYQFESEKFTTVYKNF